MDLRKNDTVNGEIIDFNDDGQGVLKTDNNIVVFVPNAIPGESVNALIINDKKNYKIAKAFEIQNASPQRIEPPCPYYLKCGGCDIMHLNKTCQINFKTTKVLRAFKKVANLSPQVLPCVQKNDFYYRNKIALPISKDGKPGLYRKNSHTLIKINDCIITEQWNKDLIEIINKYIQESNITCFDETTNTGQLKHIVARCVQNQLLVTLVVTSENIPNTKLLIELLKTKFTNFGLNLNINKLYNNVILSQTWKPVYGNQEIMISEFGITYPVSNASFFQINNEIKTELYSAVINQIPTSATVIDAYSGAGLLSAIISKKSRVVYGVELIKEATENANKLKADNNLNNLFNINGDCTKVIPELIKNNDFNNLVVTLDPPRKGATKPVLDAIIKACPNKIIYISCDPNTLARDAKIILDSNNFNLSIVQPYDMFPQTKHVETLAVFVKN